MSDDYTKLLAWVGAATDFSNETGADAQDELLSMGFPLMTGVQKENLIAAILAKGWPDRGDLEEAIDCNTYSTEPDEPTRANGWDDEPDEPEPAPPPREEPVTFRDYAAERAAEEAAQDAIHQAEREKRQADREAAKADRDRQAAIEEAANEAIRAECRASEKAAAEAHTRAVTQLIASTAKPFVGTKDAREAASLANDARDRNQREKATDAFFVRLARTPAFSAAGMEGVAKRLEMS